MTQSSQTQINLVVGEEQKERWRTYAEENPDVDGTLSHLIRMAVEREVSSSRAEGDVSQMPGTEELGELLTAVRGIDTRLREIEGRLGVIERDADATGPAGEIETVAV